jgi:hypothetical protein
MFGAPVTHTESDCPNAGKLMFPQDGRHYGGHGSTDRGFYLCRFCGAEFKRHAYPEEAMRHPAAKESANAVS